MAKFILLYKGPATPQAEITAEVGAQLMQRGRPGWARSAPPWPTLERPSPETATAVVADGSTRSASDLTGYTIVEAPDLEAATTLVGGNPFLDDGSSKFAVEVYELGAM